jgi:hypothetical protein
MTITMIPLHQQRNEQGLLMYCSQCSKLATGWQGKTPFCSEHWTLKWYMERQRSEQHEEEQKQQ